MSFYDVYGGWVDVKEKYHKIKCICKLCARHFLITTFFHLQVLIYFCTKEVEKGGDSSLIGRLE